MTTKNADIQILFHKAFKIEILVYWCLWQLKLLHLLHQCAHSVGIRRCLHVFLKLLQFFCVCKRKKKKNKIQKGVRKTVSMILPNLHLTPAHHHVRICIILLGNSTFQAELWKLIGKTNVSI